MYWMYIWMVKFIKGEINIYSLSENVHCLQYMNVNLRTLLRTNWNETFFTSHQRICFVLQCIVVCYRCLTDTLQRNKEEMFMHKMCLMTQEQIWKGKTDTEVIIFYVIWNVFVPSSLFWSSMIYAILICFHKNIWLLKEENPCYCKIKDNLKLT